MESEESCEQMAGSGIPRGGPIYLPNMVAHLSTVPDFQSSYLDLLQDLETQLSMESPSSSHQYDVSTDTLKIYTEEELTDMAMKEAFQEDDLSKNELEQSLNANLSQNELKQSLNANLSQNELEQSLNASDRENPSAGKGKETKRKRTVKKTEVKKTIKKNEVKKTIKKNEVKKTVKKTEESYIAKVEQLAKLKQKQDEDKADVRLHCFSKTWENGEDVSASPEGFEQMQSLKSIENYTLVKPSDIQGLADMLFPEVIMCVEVYNRRKLKTQEFLVLGRQMLTELKDKIHCVTDQVMEKAGKYDPSGYFLIEDVFHNDLRNPSATDYSRPILDWLWNSEDEAHKKWEAIITGELQQKQKAVLGGAKAMGLPRFVSAEMQSTRFCDLRFKLGASYLYCHQGNCKHMIVIRDMRLSHPEDVQNRAAYPRLMYQLKPRLQKCSVCKISRASKVALDDKWAIENPCYFCDTCFALLHIESPSLNCDFPVFDYLYE